MESSSAHLKAAAALLLQMEAFVEVVTTFPLATELLRHLRTSVSLERVPQSELTEVLVGVVAGLRPFVEKVTEELEEVEVVKVEQATEPEVEVLASVTAQTHSILAADTSVDRHAHKVELEVTAASAILPHPVTSFLAAEVVMVVVEEEGRPQLQ